MLNIRKKTIAMAVAILVTTHIVAPAHAVTPKKFKLLTQFQEMPVTVELAHMTVRVTKTQARKALASGEAKYFDAEAIAFLTVYSNSWSVEQWKCLQALWTHESHFNPKSSNKSSGAYGIAQFLPTTWGNYKVHKTSNPSLQIKYGVHYIQKRYGDACNAWNFWKKHYWY